MTAVSSPNQARVEDLLGPLPAPRSRSGTFSVEDFIRGADPQSEADLRCKLPVLVRLSRKAEIAKAVYAFYTEDLSRPASDEVLQPEYAAAFCGLCLAAAEHLGHVRSLNCALKMLDGILRQPQVEYGESLRRAASRLVD